MTHRAKPPATATAELRKRLCGELAVSAATPEGLDRLRRLQASALAGRPLTAEPDGGGARPAEEHDRPAAIGDLRPDATGIARRSRRTGGGAAPGRPRRSVPAPSHRVVLLGES